MALTEYSNSVLADTPWAFAKFTETSGTALADSSGMSHGLTISGSYTLAQAAPYGGVAAIAFGAAAGSAITSATFDTGQVTQEAWVYLAALPTTNTGVLTCIAGAVGANVAADKTVIIDTAGKVNFLTYPGSSKVLTAGSALSLNTWHHVVCSVGPLGAKIRVDKVTQALDNTYTTSETGTAKAWAVRGASQGPFAGLATNGTAPMVIALPAVYQSQLSDARTDAHYDALFYRAPSGDSFPIDANTIIPFAPSGDSFSIDAGVVNTAVNPTAVMAADVQLNIASATPPVAVMAADINLTNTQSPARLKMWDGSVWVPVRTYYYNTTTQAWTPSA